MPRSGPPPPNIGRAPERRHSEAPAHRAIASGNIAAARRRRYRRAGAGHPQRRAAVFLSSPLQGGGREGGPAPGCVGVPPASRKARTRARAFGPLGRRDAGASRQLTDERDREGPRPGCGAGSTPLPTSPFRGEERSREDARSPPTPDPEADRCRLLSSPLSGGRSGGGSRAVLRARPGVWRAAVSAIETLSAGRRRRSGGGRETPRLICGAGSTPHPASPRAIAFGNFAMARRHRYRRAGGRGRRFLSSPLPGGRSADGAARLPVRPSRAFPNGPPDSSPFQGGGVKTESQVRLPCAGAPLDTRAWTKNSRR